MESQVQTIANSRRQMRFVYLVLPGDTESGTSHTIAVDDLEVRCNIETPKVFELQQLKSLWQYAG